MKDIIILLALLFQAYAQPRCVTSPFPLQLPLTSAENFLLDLNNYFEGPNITLHLSPPDPAIAIHPKYSIDVVSHNLGLILSIATASNVLSMLGLTSTNKYYIYYASIEYPEDLTAKDLPKGLTNCQHHSISPDGSKVTVACDSSKGYSLAHGSLTMQIDDWEIFTSKALVAATSRKVLYLSTTMAAHVIMNPLNSYVELWDVKYGRVAAVYDRVFLGETVLNIIDAKASQNLLYLLDQYSGIYLLELFFDRLVLMGSMELPFYSKLAVLDNSVVVWRKGILAEITQDNIFKYETINVLDVKDLAISSEFIVLYASSQISIYMRGVMSPYLIVPTALGLIAQGCFIDNFNLLQVLSQKMGDINSDTELQKVQISHPFLQINSSAVQRKISIIGSSRVLGLEQTCSITFTLVRTAADSWEIFDSGYDRNGTEHIYMNRPGRAEVQLWAYGMGPNLEYDIVTFDKRLNLLTEFRKLKPLKSSQIKALEKTVVQNAHFSRKCLSTYTRCPLVIDDGLQPFLRYFDCLFRSDLSSRVTGIECSERRKELKLEQYKHFEIVQQTGKSTSSYIARVTVGSQNLTSILRLLDADQNSTVITVAKVAIQGANKFHENNISSLLYDPDSARLYVLLKVRKLIQVYQIFEQEVPPKNEIGEGDNVKLLFTINSDSVGGKFFAPQAFKLDSEDLLWVSNYDQFFVFSFSNGDVELVASVPLKVSLKQGWTYSFEVLETVTKQKQVQRYLVICDTPSTLAFCIIDMHFNLFGSSCSNLPLYNRTIMSKVIQNLGDGKIGIQLYDPSKLTKALQIYDLKALTLVSSAYTSIASKNESFWCYFHQNSDDPILLAISIIQNASITEFYALSLTPKLIFSLDRGISPVGSELAILEVFNREDHIRHTLTIGISNNPQNLTKGAKFPHSIKRESTQYIELDSRGWTVGNVLNISYSCDDCDIFHPRPGQPYVSVHDKLWLQDEIQINAAEAITVLRRQGKNYLGVIKQNIMYFLDHNTHSISLLLRLSPEPEDDILFVRLNNELQILVALSVNQRGEMWLYSYSMASHKGFPLDSFSLPKSIQYVYNVEYRGNVVLVVDFNNIYINSVDLQGRIFLVDYISEEELGGDICWAQLLHRGGQNYSIIATLCKSGISYITFSLDEHFTSLTIANRQAIDLTAYLNKVNVRIPTDATFRRSLSLFNSPNSIAMTTLVSSFNSLRWVLSLKNEVVVVNISVTSMLHRYGDFTSAQEISVDPSGRFIALTYFGEYKGKNQYIHAVYDLQDCAKSEMSDNYNSCYIMQTVADMEDHQTQFIANSTMLGLSDGGTSVKVWDVSNSFRATIYNADKLYTQSVYVVPSTPVSSILIEVRIHGIDVVVWEIWEILLIILALVILLGILGFVANIFWKSYQQKKKLVPLLLDYAEYEEDLAEQEGQMEGTRGGAINESVRSGAINESVRGSAAEDDVL